MSQHEKIMIQLEENHAKMMEAHQKRIKEENHTKMMEAHEKRMKELNQEIEQIMEKVNIRIQALKQGRSKRMIYFGKVKTE